MRAREIIFYALTMMAAVGAGLLAADWPWGVPGEWQWQRRVIELPRWWMPLAPSMALIAFSLWLVRRVRRGAKAAAIWALPLVLLAFMLQLSTLAIAPASTVRAGAVILSPVATTYFTEAAKISDLRQFLGDYANRMRAFSQHAQTYPPGPIVFFWSVRQVVERSPGAQAMGAILVAAATGLAPADAAGAYARLYGRPVTGPETVAAVLAAWLLGLLGCVSIAPIFLLARDRWGDAAAVCAGALTAALPSLILFTPSILQLVTLEAALALYVFHLAWSRGSAAWGAAAGAMWAICMLTSLAMLAVAPLLVAWVLIGRFGGQDQRWASAWPKIAAAWIGGALGVLAVAYLALGINFPAIMQSALSAHREVTTRAFARTYWRWLGWNLFDFWMFLGAGLGLWLARQMWAEAAAAARGYPKAWTALLWALAATLVALDLSGLVRAEVGRIWMFLMPPAAAAAAAYITSRERPDLALGIILAAQLVQIYAFQSRLALFVVL
jgi:hypothetical protein